MDNYLIYLGSGGLCHCLSGLSKAIKLSIENNRILVIDTFKLKSFENKLCFFFDLNIDNLIIKYDYYDIYDKKVLNMSVSDFKNIYPKLIGNYYYINKHNVTNTDLINYNDSIVVYCGYGGNYINPNIKVNSFFKQFVKKNLKDYESIKNYISIQFRNTDKKNNHENILNKIKQHIKKIKRNNIKNIFLATDNPIDVDIFKESLKEFNIFNVCNIEYFKGKCIHYNCKDKNKLTIDLLKDIYMILRSKFFIPSINSGVSKWIIQMINDKNNIFDIESETQIWFPK